MIVVQTLLEEQGTIQNTSYTAFYQGELWDEVRLRCQSIYIFPHSANIQCM